MQNVIVIDNLQIYNLLLSCMKLTLLIQVQGRI